VPEETPPKALLQVIDSLCPAIVLRGFRVGLADSTGTLQTQYTFAPLGNTTVTGASTTNSFAYTGRELDATGLYFYRARYYNPTVQRFISEDPIGFSGGDVNLYAYTGNSPTNLRDPSGKIAPLVVGGVLCGTGAAIGGTTITKANRRLAGRLRSGDTPRVLLPGVGADS